MSAQGDVLAVLADLKLMACDAHDYTADVRDRAEAALAAVAELVEAAGNVLADWEYCGSPGIPGGIIGKPQLVLLKAALAKFGGAACTLRDGEAKQPAAKPDAAPAPTTKA